MTCRRNLRYETQRYVLGQLSTLIKGWSALSSTFDRRDSCQFTSCVSPCVRKATTHLQQLKDRLTRLSLAEEDDTWKPKDIDDKLTTLSEGIFLANSV